MGKRLKAFYWFLILACIVGLYGLDCSLDNPMQDRSKKRRVDYWMRTAKRETANAEKAGHAPAISSIEEYLNWLKEANPNGYDFLGLILKVDSQTNKVYDPWGNPIVTQAPGDGKLLLLSYGPNGQDDGGQEDDITHLIRLESKEGTGDEGERESMNESK